MQNLSRTESTEADKDQYAFLSVDLLGRRSARPGRAALHLMQAGARILVNSTQSIALHQTVFTAPLSSTGLHQCNHPYNRDDNHRRYDVQSASIGAVPRSRFDMTQSVCDKNTSDQRRRYRDPDLYRHSSALPARLTCMSRKDATKPSAARAP